MTTPKDEAAIRAAMYKAAVARWGEGRLNALEATLDAFSHSLAYVLGEEMEPTETPPDWPDRES